MEEIAVGELVIMQNAGHYEEWNGALGVVVGCLLPRRPVDLNTMTRIWMMCYRVKILVEDGRVVSAGPDQVRRLRERPDDEGEQHVIAAGNSKLVVS